jgi:hypothetical protein
MRLFYQKEVKMSTVYTTSTRHSPPATLTIPLTAHHIRFTVRAVTPIVFNDFKGSALRGAFATVLRRTFCPQGERDPMTEQYHQALCPVCRLLGWDGDEETSGDVRRAYAIEPPLTDQSHFAPGDTFTFGAALYGDSWSLFPYVALAAGGMGEFGVGKKVASGEWQGASGAPRGLPRGAGGAGDGGRERGERGRFVVEQIEAVNPLTGERLVMMAPGEHMVRTETLPITQAQVDVATAQWLPHLAAQGNQLTIAFLTPTRLTIQGDHIAKQPDFFPLIKQTVLRLLDLAAQHGGGRPTINGEAFALRGDLYQYADQVELVADHTQWWDAKGHSSRLGRQQVLGGFVGHATYHAPDWRPLLPWLLWGQSTHVGKNIVKGCGIYQVVGGEGRVAGGGYSPTAPHHPPPTTT